MNSNLNAAEEPSVSLRQFLRSLAEDIAAHPERLKAIDAKFLERLRGITEGVEVDVADALSPEDE